jgi:hypothetical protein
VSTSRWLMVLVLIAVLLGVGAGMWIFGALT